METINNYENIKGWGVDADPQNEPTYPMKKYTGDDHKRSNWQRPELQSQKVEILHSNERPGVSAVFGTVLPPKGLSGSLRRVAFKYSESDLRHWFTLILADRINAVEGLVDDIMHGYIPDYFGEKGWGAMWKFNKKLIIKKVAVGTLITGSILILMINRNRKKFNVQ